MTIELFCNEVKIFLQESEPFTLAIKGEWGIGKTYIWKSLFYELRDEIPEDRYCYLSLMGLKSIDEVRAAIFANQEPTSRRSGTLSKWLIKIIKKTYYITKSFFKTILSPKKTIKTISKISIYLWNLFKFKSIKNIANYPINISGIFNFIQKIFSTGKASIPGSAWATLQLLFEKRLKNSIICIDDFERLDKSISTEQIFGLISLLKEKNNCKIAIILNDKKLTDDQRKFLDETREKFIDIELEFNPTPADCAKHVLGKMNNENSEDTIDTEKLIEDISFLKIRNIRIIKKIANTYKKAIEQLPQCENETKDYLRKAITLFILDSNRPEHEKIPEKYIFKNKLNLSLTNRPISNDKESPSETIIKEKEFNNFLLKYDFNPIAGGDNLNNEIINYINSGIFNEKLKSEINIF